MATFKRSLLYDRFSALNFLFLENLPQGVYRKGKRRVLMIALRRRCLQELYQPVIPAGFRRSLERGQAAQPLSSSKPFLNSVWLL